jgi:hypothetical protein
MPRGLGSAQRVVIAVGVDAQAWAPAVDGLDGVAFAGSDSDMPRPLRASA